MTAFHVIFFGFIIIAGYCNGSAKNLANPKGLAPFGARGVLDGAAIVYFSYIGYDSASTMAEEVKDPFKSLPIGIVGSVLTTTLLYCLMSLSLCMMVPYNKVSIVYQTISVIIGLNKWTLTLVIILYNICCVSDKANSWCNIDIRESIIFNSFSENWLELGEQSSRGRCKFGHSGFSLGCHARPSKIPLCYWKGKVGSILVSQSTPFNRHTIECHGLFG